MPIPVACTCGKKFQAKDELAGKRVKCPGCGATLNIAVPSASQAPARSPSKSPAKPRPQPKPAAADDDFLGAGIEPLGSSDPFGSLDALNQAASGPGPLGGFGDPLMQGQPPALGNPMLGGNPLLGASPLMGGGQFGQQPAGQGGSGGGNKNLVLYVGIGGGALALLIVVGLIVAVVTRDKPAVAPVAQTPPAKQAPDNTNVAPSTAPGTASSPASSTPPAEPASVTESTSPDVGSTQPTTQSAEAGGQAPPSWFELGKPVDARLNAASPLIGARRFDDLPINYGYSWLVELLPHLGYDDVYGRFDFKKSWSDKGNLQLTGVVVPAFLNPGDPQVVWQGYPFEGMALTHFVGMSGVEESRNDVAASYPRSDPRAGMFGYASVARPAEISDGQSQTIMLIGSGKLAGPWVQGGGATIRGARQPYFDEYSGFGSKGVPAGGALVVLADGSVRTIQSDVSPQVFKALCTIHGADTVDSSHLADVPAELLKPPRPVVPSRNRSTAGSNSTAEDPDATNSNVP